MPIETNHTFMATLADILTNRKVEAQNIYNFVQFICNEFSFDAGCIYEADQTGTLQLRECCSAEMLKLQPRFVLTDLSTEAQEQLTASLLVIDDQQAAAPHEKELLNLFSAASLVAAPVIEKTGIVQGLIIFLNMSPQSERDAHTNNVLRILLKVLEKEINTRLYQKHLFAARHLFENILEHTGIDIYVNDFHTHEILYVNESMAAPYGGKKNFMGSKCWQTLFPGQTGPCTFCPQMKLIDDNGNPTKVYSWDYQRPFDGSWFRVFSSAFSWVDGRLAHVVSSADITDNKRNEELIHYMANYDSLTQLPNRRMLVSECERRITNALPDSEGYLLFFDIDGFKTINDDYGHEAGDEFLVQLGNFFSGIPMLKNAIYRNGGDEFVALIDNGTTHANIQNLANFIHERFKKPWKLKKANVFCNVSVGAACFPEDGNTAEILVNKADQAMYYIKKRGGGKLAFFQDMT